MSQHETIEGPPFPRFLCGLDLGKATDYTALAVIEKNAWNDGHRYDVVALLRASLGTPYPRVVDAVAGVMRRPDLRPLRQYPPRPGGGAIRVEPAPDPVLVVDATGVGTAVVDMFLETPIDAAVIPVTITSGGTTRKDHWNGQKGGRLAYWTPKIELVGVIQTLLQTERLKFADGLELGDVLRDELNNFEVKITQSAHESFGAWRTGKHDDLVLAVALACWYGERAGRESVDKRATIRPDWLAHRQWGQPASLDKQWHEHLRKSGYLPDRPRSRARRWGGGLG